MKGFSHIDFIIASSIFILVFVIVISTLTNFFTGAESSVGINTITGQSFSLLSAADFGYNPENWTGMENISRIGFAKRETKITVVVDNSKPFLKNQSNTVVDLQNEIVSINFTGLGVTPYINSTYVENETGQSVSYNINGLIINFSANVEANSTRTFTIYFGYLGNFSSLSKTVSGTDSLNELIYPPVDVDVLGYDEIRILNSSNYNFVKNSTGLLDFRIVIFDEKTNSSYIDYGGQVPDKGNVVALQRYILYQNETAGVRKGRLIVRSW